jgi:glc operon protein GlcG
VLATKKSLTLTAAKRIAAAAVDKAGSEGWRVVIVVADDGGYPVYLERLDGAQLGSIEVALQKARAAILFKRPTKVFEDLVAGGRTTLLKLPQSMPMEGGLPLELNGVIVGSIGVSGVTAAQDGLIAQAGADAFLDLAKE